MLVHILERKGLKPGNAQIAPEEDGTSRSYRTSVPARAWETTIHVAHFLWQRLLNTCRDASLRIILLAKDKLTSEVSVFWLELRDEG